MMATSDRCLILQGGRRNQAIGKLTRAMPRGPKAVRDAGTDAPEQAKRAMQRQSTTAPSGIAAVDRATRHLCKQARIGKARPDGQFELVWNSDETLRPNPFPDYRSESDWLQRVNPLTGARP